MAYRFQGKNSSGYLVFWSSDVPDWYGDGAPDSVSDVAQVIAAEWGGTPPAPAPPPPPAQTGVLTEEFTASPGQTIFSVQYPPIGVDSIFFFVNDTISTDITVSGVNITYSGPTLVGGEIVVIKYFENVSINAQVNSVFGRTNVVTAQSGDYSASLITNNSSVSGSTVKSALETLSDILNLGTSETNTSYTLSPNGTGGVQWGVAPVDSVFGRSGIITAQSGDYDTDLITNASTKLGSTLSDALNNLTFIGLNDVPSIYGTPGQVLKVNNTSDGLIWGTDSATAGGPDRSIQFSNTGVIDGNSTLLWTSNTTDRVIDIASSSSALTQVGMRVKSSANATVLELLYNENAGSVKLNAPAHSLDLSGQTKVKIQGISRFGASASDPVGGVAGDEYWNTTLKERMYYDGTRWVSGSVRSIASGRSGNTSAGQYYRGVDTLLLDGANKGFPVQKGSCTYLGLTRTDSGATTLEVLVNGVVVGTLAHSAAGLTSSTTVFDFPAGLMSFRNIGTGVQTTDVQIQLHYKLRA